MPIWCLDVHAGWRCRHTARCCSAGWRIPIEPPAFERARIHFASRSDAARLFVVPSELPPDAAAFVGVKADGTCVFLHGDARRGRCEIHRSLGADALPAACRQFPRVTLHDARGTFLSLSHFCPTAASMLLEPARLAVVAAPAELTLGGNLEGLDARNVLPPLLTRGVLTDLDGYEAWERRSIAALAGAGAWAREAIGVIERATVEVEQWRPGPGHVLTDHVHRAFDRSSASDEGGDASTDATAFQLVAGSVPDGLGRPGQPPIDLEAWTAANCRLREFDRAVRAWLSARLFGNWIAYSAPGLRLVAAALRAYLAVLTLEIVRTEREQADLSNDRRFIEAVRQADLLIVHLSDVRLLVARLAQPS